MAIFDETTISGASGDDWGPLVGPWVRHSGNPVLPKAGEPYKTGMCPGTDSIIFYAGRLWMFIYNQDGHNTRLAVSNDGFEWEHIHGGAPIIKAEAPWEGSYALTKAVEVIGGKVYLYYMGKQGIQERIGIATNTDPDLAKAQWEKHSENPVFTKDKLAAPVQRVFPGSVVKDYGTYYFFLDSGYGYHHPKYPRQYTINVASGRDGIHFEELAADIIKPGPEDYWDSQSVSQAAVRKIGDWWYMLYSGFPKGAGKSAQAFGLARALKPEGPWDKYPGNPIFTATGNKEDWDSEFLQHACPVKINGKWHLYYAGNDLNPTENTYRIGLAMRAGES